ncbi:LAMI_0F10396g1_1 [Lachancea mirantina]|uniref:RING-type E3 ubiquitin transferase n=1 Tax=Lachancea mirantina TaxID=1230905 RepID=A0A1G4K1S7_9SACH|nr:LAMI_0F10396g1_1 [Lachancea mirantina]
MEIDVSTIILAIVFFFLFFSSPSGDGVTSQYEFNQLQTLKDQWQSEYDEFQNITIGTNFRNITGWKLSYQDVESNPEINATYPIENKDYTHWSNTQDYTVLPKDILKRISSKIWVDGKNVFPPNITSTLHGAISLTSNDKYEHLPMPVANFYEPPDDFSQSRPKPGERYLEDWPHYGQTHNVTFKHGEVVVQISHADAVSSRFDGRNQEFFNTQSDKWRMLHMQIDFTDSSEKEKHTMSSKAVYDVEKGRIVAMSQSAKFHSLFGYPHYMSLLEDDDKSYDQVKRLMNEYWNASNYVDTLSMRQLQEEYDVANYKCEFMAFLQLEPWDKFTRDQIKVIDQELMWPTGRLTNLSQLPPVNLASGLLYSPDCGLSLEFNNVKGPRYELQVRQIRKHLLVGIALFAGQIYLLLSQMHHTNTPSAVNKMSFWCFYMMNLVDGSLALIYLVASSALMELYLPLIMSAFACLILAMIFETRYLVSIYASQVNERNVGILTLIRGNRNTEEITVPTTIPDEAAISSSIYGRFFFTLMASTFLILSALTWPRNVRTMFEYTCVILLNSYWLPQIIRNAIKGGEPRRQRNRHTETNQTNQANPTPQAQTSMPLLWRFVLGTSFIRITPVLYVFTYSSNVFRHHTDVRFVVILFLWVLFQIAVLYSQDILGARWFLPKSTIPEGYSYHKGMVSQDLLEHGCTEDYTVECAICMNNLPVYVDDIPETHNVDTATYMVTPCDHVFHTRCLESWMNYKLQCPVCRAPLPPL